MISNLDASRPSTPVPADGGSAHSGQSAPEPVRPTFQRSATPTAGSRDALPAKPRSLYTTTLEEALWTGSPSSIASVLDHAKSRGKLKDPEFCRFVLDTLVRRTDAQAFDCLQRAIACLKPDPIKLFKAALTLKNQDLILELSQAYPAAITAHGWHWLGENAPELGRAILQSRPELDFRVPFDRDVLGLYLPPSAFVKPKAPEERQGQQTIVLQAMQRFPHRADYIAQCAAGGHMREAWAWALEHSDVPRRAEVWEAALQRVPDLVRALIDKRPETINGALIIKAANLVRNDILEAACKARPSAMHELDDVGWTPARIVANVPVYAEQFEIMRRYGADPGFVPPAEQAAADVEQAGVAIPGHE